MLAKPAWSFVIVVGLLARLSCPIRACARRQPRIQSNAYVAPAINIGVPGRTGSGTVEIGIEHWSTEQGRDRLRTVLFEQGPEKLLDALRKMPRVGYIRTPNSIGYDLHYARRTPEGDGGERVIIATDRYIGFCGSGQPTSHDRLPVHTDRNADRIQRQRRRQNVDRYEDYSRQGFRGIVLENYSSQPVQLTDVRRDSGNEK